MEGREFVRDSRHGVGIGVLRLQRFAPPLRMARLNSSFFYTFFVSRSLHPGGSKRIVGVLLIGLLIMIFTLVRFWHSIPWKVR